MSWYRRRHLHQTPEPVARVGRGGVYRLWLWPDWERWGWEHDLLQQNVHVENPDRDTDTLITGREISEMMGWRNGGTAWQLSQRSTFPQPAQQYGRTRLWWKSEVVAWATTARRRPGRRSAPGSL